MSGKPCTLVIKGFPCSWTEEDVAELVTPFVGPTTHGSDSESTGGAHVQLCRDFTTRESRCESYVTVPHGEVATEARLLLDGVTIEKDGTLFTLSVSLECEHDRQRVVVIGAGLAGLSAALEAADAGAHVVVLDKTKFGVGNSGKASSGMNAYGTPTQAAAEEGVEDGDGDSVEAFVADTLTSGHGLSDAKLVNALVADSTAAWQFLADHGIVMDAITRCGGHSHARTHRVAHEPGSKPINIGWEIMRTIKQHALDHPHIHAIFNARASKLISNGWKVSGVSYTLADSDQVFTLPADAVVLATGGFSASTDLLAEHAPERASFPTTNGDFATGDGIALAREMGALITQMDQVQVHPTGFVNLADPGAQTKFLAPEALRAYGGLLLTHEGKRFTNELGRRDDVSQAILDNCAPAPGTEHPAALLVMPNSVREGFDQSIFDFYVGRGLIHKLEGGIPDLVARFDTVDADAVVASFASYHADHHNTEGFAVDPSETLFVAMVCPALHYTMGGVVTSPHGEVLNEAHLDPIPGLYAAGEVTGGLHGGNRLAGNSLLDCVVFGRRAGAHAALHKPKRPALSPTQWRDLVLQERIQLSPTTILFRFALPFDNAWSGLEVGEYLATRIMQPVEGNPDADTEAEAGEAGPAMEELVRYYSPISRPDANTLDLCVKMNTKGAMSAFFESLSPGESLAFKGPIAGLEFQVGSKKRLSLLAGGTGISPMFQIIRAHLLWLRKVGEPQDLEITLMYAAKDLEEILLREVLEKHAAKHPNELKLFYSLMEPPAEWHQGTGFITADMIAENCAEPSDDHLVVICGPPPFCKAMCAALDSLGFERGRHYYSYL